MWLTHHHLEKAQTFLKVYQQKQTKHPGVIFPEDGRSWRCSKSQMPVQPCLSSFSSEASSETWKTFSQTALAPAAPFPSFEGRDYQDVSSELMEWWHQQKQCLQLKNNSEKPKGSGHIQWNVFPGKASVWAGLSAGWNKIPTLFQSFWFQMLLVGRWFPVNTGWTWKTGISSQMPEQEPHPWGQSRNLSWTEKKFPIKPQVLKWEKVGEAWRGAPHNIALAHPW